jgi:hypothetical protein
LVFFEVTDAHVSMSHSFGIVSSQIAPFAPQQCRSGDVDGASERAAGMRGQTSFC